MLTPFNFTCQDALEHLDDYRRNSIEPHLRVMLSEHLATCEGCAGELQFRDSMARHLQMALPHESPTPQLPVSVKRAIRQMSDPSRENRSSHMLPWMLTAALVIGIGVAALQMRSTPPLQVATEVAATRPDYGVQRDINQAYHESIAAQQLELKRASRVDRGNTIDDASPAPQSKAHTADETRAAEPPTAFSAEAPAAAGIATEATQPTAKMSFQPPQAREQKSDVTSFAAQSMVAGQQEPLTTPMATISTTSLTSVPAELPTETTATESASTAPASAPSGDL